MDPNGQHDSDVEGEGAWPSPAPDAPQFRPPNAAARNERVKKERVNTTEETGTSHPTGSRIKQEQQEPVDEAREPSMPPCEYTPRGSVAPRPAPSQFKPPRLENPPLDDVAPQIEDPLFSAHMQINLQQEEIDELKQQLIDQEKELTLKFEEQLKKIEEELTLKHENELKEIEQLKEQLRQEKELTLKFKEEQQTQREMVLTLKYENKILSQKVKFSEEMRMTEQQSHQKIIELMQSQMQQNQHAPQYMMPPQFMPAPPTSTATNFTVPVPHPIHPMFPNPSQLDVAQAPASSSAPAPRGLSVADSSRKTSVAPRESSSESMEPPQPQRRRYDKQHNRGIDHQVKKISNQRFAERIQERDSFDSNRGSNLQDFEIGDQPEEPQRQRSDERKDQRMETGRVPEMEELDLPNEQPVGNQEAIDFPDLEEQPEDVEAAHEEPMEEENKMAPLQNEGLVLDDNEVEDDEEIDDEEAQVPPAVVLRRSGREKQPVSQIQPKYEKNQIRNNKLPSTYHKKEAVLARSARNCKKYKKRNGRNKRTSVW